MTDKIEVYVKTEKKLVGQYTSAPISDGVMTHSCLSKKMLEYEKALPEADKRALELVKEFAEKRGLVVDVFDVSTLKGKLKAGTKGISKTPAIAVGQERIEATSNIDQLKERLEAHFKRADT
jgi:hypothetical protein